MWILQSGEWREKKKTQYHVSPTKRHTVCYGNLPADLGQATGKGKMLWKVKEESTRQGERAAYAKPQEKPEIV